MILAAAAVVLAAVAGVTLEWERRRRHARGQERGRTEARRVASRAVLTEVQAADQDWWYAHLEHDWRIYVYAGRVRALGLASKRRADALRHAVTVQLRKNGPLVSDEWRLPYELRCERTDRPSLTSGNALTAPGKRSRRSAAANRARSGRSLTRTPSSRAPRSSSP